VTYSLALHTLSYSASSHIRPFDDLDSYSSCNAVYRMHERSERGKPTDVEFIRSSSILPHSTKPLYSDSMYIGSGIEHKVGPLNYYSPRSGLNCV
jgi:hypothetical protein